MAKISYKASYYALYACVALIVVVFAVFFLVGFDNMEGDKNVPVCTDVLMYLMYGMILGTVGLTVWSGLFGLQNGGSNAESINGVPASKISIGAIVLLVASLAIGYFANMGAEDFRTTSGTEVTANWVQISDMFIWSIGILVVGAVVATIVNMAGILKK